MNLIDPSRVFIRGGSAGGYTVLAAISNPPPDTPTDFKWTGATSLYGVSDLRRLAEDTHKFESKYLDGLVGGSYEEIPEVFKERSPISHADKIDTPLLVSLILPRSCCGYLGSEVDRELRRSSKDRTMRLFRPPKQNLFCAHWRNEARKSNIFSSKVKGTGGGRPRTSRQDSRQS